jgi:hypothetical protein
MIQLRWDLNTITAIYRMVHRGLGQEMCSLALQISWSAQRHAPGLPHTDADVVRTTCPLFKRTAGFTPARRPTHDAEAQRKDSCLIRNDARRWRHDGVSVLCGNFHAPAQKRKTNSSLVFYSHGHDLDTGKPCVPKNENIIHSI